jgi:subtilisin family serine protease
MKRWVPFAVVALAVTACQDASGPAAKLALAPRAALIRAANPIPGSYIVVMKDAVVNVDGEVDQIGQQYGTSASYRYKYALKGFAGKLSAAAVDALRRDPRVAYIEEDQMAHLVATQANPPSWGLDRIDQSSLPLSNSYTYNQTGVGVDAYIIDTGIRTTHTEFGGRAVFGYDAITPGGTTDGNGHGTHVAGTVGGSSYGVAKGVHLIAVRVLDNSGSGTYAQVIAGIDWVTADHTTHPAVANMSLGGPVDAALDQAVRNSIADGVTYCIAAGNSSANAATQSPADVVEAITVGATDISDAFATFSNFGSVVDILAPGVNITSSWNTSNTATNTISGTSMATPHVTGVAALYLEANPAATPASVQSALVSNASLNKISGVPSGTANRLLYSIFGPPPPPPPAAPGLVSPANGATNVAVPTSLTWSAPTGNPTSYRVQVSTSSAFTTLAYDQSGLTSTSTTVSGLSAGVVYYWRVNASNAGGAGAWSVTWSFTTTPPPAPAAPVLTGPANGASGVSIPATLTWNAAANATTYRVIVSTNSGFAGTPVYDATVTTTSTSVSNLSPSTPYYWHVIAGNTGTATTPSADWSFTTSAAAPTPPPVPVLVSPANAATGVAVPTTLTWNASTGATSYTVQVSTSSTFATFAYNASVTTTSTTVSGLAANTRYYWRVNASNTGATSAFSASRYFNTAAAACTDGNCQN